MLLIASEGVAQTVAVNGGNPVLTITTGIANGQLVNKIDMTSSLTYTTPNSSGTWKITTGTTCIGQRFTLSVVTTNPAPGNPAPEVTLINGGLDQDFIRDIPRKTNDGHGGGGIIGTCTLTYTASATFDQETGTDSHTVIYTIQAQ